MTGIDALMHRHQRRTAPAKFWLEVVETFLFLAGLMTVVNLAVWFAT